MFFAGQALRDAELGGEYGHQDDRWGLMAGGVHQLGTYFKVEQILAHCFECDLMGLHLMESRAAAFFLFLYYIRPQDWITGLAGFNIIRPMILIWGVGLIGSQQRSPFPGVIRTPHDWIMLAYFAWVVLTAPAGQGTFTAFLPLVIFYMFTVQSLSSWERVLGYLKAWNYALLGVALIAVASLYKIDLTGAVEMTELNGGRLAIGTWMHNNPNALGHSVAVVVPLSYILYFWRCGVIGRMVIFPLQSGLALYCIYETQSKGAFLVTAAMMVMIFVIGRPLPVKLFALVLAVSLGVSALSFLPRMSDMNNLRSEAGVQGRLMAWELARTAMERNPAGWKQFVAYINWFGLVEKKATHSSYVQVGADLGVNGMFIYLLALWVSFRTTLQIHRHTVQHDDMERCRRASMVLIIAYVISGWMINREYHTEYFLLIAVAAAMHRLHKAREAQDIVELVRDEDWPENESFQSNTRAKPNARVSFAPVLPVPSGCAGLQLVPVVQQGRRMEVRGAKIVKPAPNASAEVEELADARHRIWNRVDVVDLSAAAGLTWLVLYIWDYILKSL